MILEMTWKKFTFNRTACTRIFQTDLINAYKCKGMMKSNSEEVLRGRKVNIVNDYFESQKSFNAMLEIAKESIITFRRKFPATIFLVLCSLPLSLSKSLYTQK